MTENEAINGWTFEETIQTTENLMEVENNVFKWDVLRHLRDFAESFKDELEQYRAIGTVEELKTAMKYVSLAKKHGTVGRAIDACAEYESIGTVEEFKALKEKNEPKELAEHNFQDEVHHYLCPSCRSIVSCTQNYCDECGQALET